NKLSGKCLDVAGAATGNNANIQQFTCNSGSNQRFFWSIYDSRHVQVVQIARSSGADRQLQSDAAINAHVDRANGVYGRYGLKLVYDPATDKSSVNNDALFNLGITDGTFTCPDGSTGNPGDCAARFAATFPGQRVLLSRPSFGFSSGAANYIAIGAMGSNSTFQCG